MINRLFYLQKRRAFLGWTGLGLASALLVSCATPSSDQAAQSSGGDGTGDLPPVEITLSSYAVAKSVFDQIIPAFQEHWKEQTGQTVTFKESYGPSGQQSRAIIEGFEADVLAQNLETNITVLVDAGLVSEDWATRLPNNAAPASTVMALVVRPDNPKNIQNWSDLSRDGIEIVAINPKTSGNARWGVLGGFGSVLKDEGEGAAQTYLDSLVQNIRVLESGGREATDAFVNQGIGDVMVNFENEILFTNQAQGSDTPYVVPPTNVAVDFPVTVVDAVVDARGTRDVAEAFVEFLFTPLAQEIYAKAGYRPIDPDVLAAHADQYQSVETIYTPADFGGWQEINRLLFADGGLFDQAQAKVRR
ncbi:sulfate transporter substrate-binding protein (plasmid) [Leptolyngbya sp. BL0902]|uniref:sulfate ABC transporter substrate-binding protein n=1 Tax=Leptolyngbya sp. BL0902 TaxID=1115757 RepID=UPI0018E6EAB1|nr:sulfate ABC transporter substrate-binding protein [Leptolyngbya sp. BL0902]QQE67586.1 sulfate transporter substrate-binding protein [Leptolyngbya sp. BL0902]